MWNQPRLLLPAPTCPPSPYPLSVPQALEAKLARGTKCAAPSAGAGASGSGGPKRERHEYDASKYTFVGADDTEKTLAAASFEDIKDLYLAVRQRAVGRGRRAGGEAACAECRQRQRACLRRQGSCSAKARKDVHKCCPGSH